MTSEKERETGKKKRSEERKGKFARAQCKHQPADVWHTNGKLSFGSILAIGAL